MIGFFTFFVSTSAFFFVSVPVLARVLHSMSHADDRTANLALGFCTLLPFIEEQGMPDATLVVPLAQLCHVPGRASSTALTGLVDIIVAYRPPGSLYSAAVRILTKQIASTPHVIVKSSNTVMQLSLQGY